MEHSTAGEPNGVEIPWISMGIHGPPLQTLPCNRGRDPLIS